MSQKKEQGTFDANEALGKSEAFFDKHKKHVTIVILALIVIIGAIFGYRAWNASREDKASTELGKAQEYFQNEMFDKALNGDGAGSKGFAAIADDYSGTEAANLANLYAGLCYANLNKWKEAQQYLEKYDTSDDAVVSPAAVAALGDADAHLGKLDDAVSKFKKAAKMADKQAADDVNFSFSPTYLLKAGMILESQGKKDEALKIYQDIKDKYVNAQIVQSTEIDKYIERASR
jgi:predicted negative regulator of RcsB-dependent stress response